MADYYTNFSFVIPIKEPVRKEYVLDLANTATVFRYDQDQLPPNFPEPLTAGLEEWWFAVEDAGEDGLWVHSETGGVDAVCAFVQHLLQKFELPGHIAFEWSHDCSKPRTNAYGGGAAIIRASEIKMVTTGGWLTEQTRHVFSPVTQLCAKCGLHADDAAQGDGRCEN